MKVSGICRSGLVAGALMLCGFPQNAMGSGGITVIPDSSVFIQVANFIFLIFALNIILYKPIRNILIQRKEKMDGLEDSIKGCHADVEEKETAWETGIREARNKGLNAKENLIKEAEAEEKEIIDNINQKAQEELQQLRQKIETDIDGVRASLQQEVDTFADAIRQKILGRAA